MFSWVSLASNLMKFGSMLAGMVRDARLRKSGRDEVGAESAIRSAKARNLANDKVRNADDATAIARRMSKRNRSF
jgi:hypothetical protein